MARLVGPLALVADAVALRTLKPLRETDANQRPFSISVFLWIAYRRKSEAFHPKLLLQPLFTHRLGVQDTGWREIAIPFFQSGGQSRYRRISRAEIDDRSRTKPRCRGAAAKFAKIVFRHLGQPSGAR
jgi:hypothetical protein